MTDEVKTSTETQVAEAQKDEKPDWRAETFKARQEKDHLQRKLDELTPKVKDLEAKAGSADTNAIELKRIKIAYEKGVPQHLLNLVTAATEADIEKQVETIMSELVKTNGETKVVTTNSEDKTNSESNNQAAQQKPQPKAAAGEVSWLEKYNKATPQERKKMDDEVKSSNTPPW